MSFDQIGEGVTTTIRLRGTTVERLRRLDPGEEYDVIIGRLLRDYDPSKDRRVRLCGSVDPRDRTRTCRLRYGHSEPACKWWGRRAAPSTWRSPQRIFHMEPSP